MFTYYIEKVGIEKYRQILAIRNEYRKHIITFQKAWREEQIKVINFLEGECNKFGFTDDLRRTIDAGSRSNNTMASIPIDELAQKYQMSSWEALNLIAPPIETNPDPDEPNYYEYKDNKYLIADPCLILDSKAKELKSLLFESNNNETITKFSEASSFLEKNDIPTSCHSVLIRKLGFDMIHEKDEKGKLNLHNPSIVQKTIYSFKGPGNGCICPGDQVFDSNGECVRGMCSKMLSRETILGMKNHSQNGL